MPGVVVANEVRDRNASIGPPSEETLKSDEAFGYEMAIFNVSIEYVSHEIEVIDLVGVCFEAVEEGNFLGPLCGGRAAAEVHVGNKEDHRTEQGRERTTRSR